MSPTRRKLFGMAAGSAVVAVAGPALAAMAPVAPNMRWVVDPATLEADTALFATLDGMTWKVFTGCMEAADAFDGRLAGSNAQAMTDVEIAVRLAA